MKFIQKKDICKMMGITLCMALVASNIGMIGTKSAYAKPEQSSGETGQEEYLQRVIRNNNGGHLNIGYVDKDGNEVEVEETSEGIAGEKSELKSSLKGDETLPSSYDPRGTEMEIDIRDQEDSGACWSFATIRALETDAVSKNIYSNDNVDLSENHLAWYTYNDYTDDTSDSTYGDSISFMSQYSYGNGTESSLEPMSANSAYLSGGNAAIATGTLASWSGAAEEKYAPFSTVDSMVNYMSSVDKSVRNTVNVRLTQSENIDASDIDAIKKKVIDNGALSIAMYYADGSLKSNSDGSYSYYQTRMKAEDANHCVTVVGYDDNYNNFSGRSVPSKPGAWLIANSYGSQNAQNGYFWLSYYDTSITEVTTYEGEDGDAHSKCYQYDGTGYSGTISDNNDIYMANIYTNTDVVPQKIDTVGFFTETDAQEYEISVYTGVSAGNPISGSHITNCDKTGKCDYSGYHTVELSSPMMVAPGESFSVVVRLKYNGQKVYACVEGENENNYISYTSHRNYTYYEIMRFAFGSKEGESYYSIGGNNSWKDASKEGYNNVCIKALGNNSTWDEYNSYQTTQTDAPEETSEPTVTQQPEETSGPTVTQQPEETSEPSDTPSYTIAPWETIKPETSAEPSDLPSPVNTQTPESTYKPTNTPVASADAPTTSTSTVINENVYTISAPAIVTIGKGEKITLPVSIAPVSAKGNLKYNSSSPAVASVTSTGVVKGVSVGTSRIEVGLFDNLKISITLNVKKKPTKVKIYNSKTGSGKKITLKKGKKLRLYPELNAGSASYKMTYTSSKTRVAKVSSAGVVKALRRGTTRISVKTYNGKKASVKIKVR